MRPRSISKLVKSAYEAGRHEGKLQSGGVLTKKDMIRYLDACQKADMKPEAEMIKSIEQSGYLEESKHLNKLYTQCQN